MPKFLILCPTYDHADTLLMSVSSVRAQTVTDWEMVVVCDGAPRRTRKIMEALCAQDRRISYIWETKSSRYGEEYRDTVIRASMADYVCHIGDDDLWTPDHLATQEILLGQAEWGNTGTIGFRPPGPLLWEFNSVDPRHKKFLPHSIGLNNVGYHRAAYMRLAVGWTAPPDPTKPSDIHMWSKFFADPALTVASTAHPTVLKFWSRIGRRQDLTSVERTAELGLYLARCGGANYMRKLRNDGDMTGALLRMFYTYACENETSIHVAADRCGLAFVGQSETPGVSSPMARQMKIPLTPDQQEQAEFVLLTLRAILGTGENAQHDRDIWRAAILVDKPSGIRMFRHLSGIAPLETLRELDNLEKGGTLPKKLRGLQHKLAANVAKV